MKVLVLGVSGMLGNAVFRCLSMRNSLNVFGTVRSAEAKKYFSFDQVERIFSDIDVESVDSLVRLYGACQPDVVVNCIGLVKQVSEANDPIQAVSINTLLPHKLAALCQVSGARLVHISTDCVFSGAKGLYEEEDFADADDLYGRSKLLGEVDYPNAVTLRTSIIGHELTGSRSLLCWFLAQQGQVRGFTKAVFSGLPTIELAKVIADVVLVRPDLRGLYHVASKPIDKYSLLRLVASVYGKPIDIVPDDKLVIDRSLSAERFRMATGYVAPEWPDLVKEMFEFK